MRFKKSLALFSIAASVVASAGYFPFTVSYEPLGAAVSMRTLLDAPAGKHGHVTVRDGHFATSAGPIRFNAVNLTGSANLPSRRFADRLAERLAGFGVNCVRLHFLDSPKGYGTFMLPNEACLLEDTDDPFDCRVNPERLDRLEYLIAALKRRGLYVNVNLHVARFMNYRMEGRTSLKGLTWLDRAIIDSEKAFAREILSHRNPHTGLSLAEDPVVAMIELNNEDAAFNDCYKAVSSGGVAFARFIADCECRYLEEMRALIKDELKCAAPLTGTQVTYTSVHVQSRLDYFDAHEYWCHPSPVAADWLVPDHAQVNFPTANCIAWLASRRVQGRPFTVSEYNNPYPSRYGTEGQLLLHAYGAYQGWDGLFAYSYDNRRDNEPDHVEYFFSLAARTDVLAHMPACAAMYLRGDVRRARRVVSAGDTFDGYLRRFAVNKTIFDDVTQATAGRIPYGAGLVAGLAFVLDGDTRGDVPFPPSDQVFKSDTGELEWNHSVSNAGFVVVRAPNVKAFTGFVRNRTFNLGDGVSLSVGPTERDWATVSFVSKNANGFGRSGAARILLAVTGQAHNSGARFTEHRQANGSVKISTRGADWGGGPFLVEGVPATVQLPAPVARCWALDERGERKASVPVRTVPGGTAVDVDGRYETVWYEIEGGR